jgi:Domain of unknown function (DUF6968)
MSRFQIDDVIAARELQLTDGDQVRTVTVRIGTPILNPGGEGEWACPYQIQGLGDEVVRAVLGLDSVQTLQLVMRVLGGTLAGTKEAQDGRLRWLDSPEFGFPTTTTGPSE